MMRIWKARQSWNYENVATIKGRKVKIRVKVDSYDAQSYATAHMFDGDKWNKVVGIAGEVVHQHVAAFTGQDSFDFGPIIELIEAEVIGLLE